MPVRRTREQLQSLTLDQLNNENISLDREKQEIRDQQRVIMDVISEKTASESAARTLAQMTPQERAAAAHMIGAIGIESQSSA